MAKVTKWRPNIIPRSKKTTLFGQNNWIQKKILSKQRKTK
jgi:hypothetical protein